MDLFFLVEDKPLLIECKAGNQYDEKIEKFVTNKEALGIEAENAILVILDIDSSEAHLRSKNWQIMVADQNRFIDFMQHILGEDDASSDFLADPDQSQYVDYDDPETRYKTVESMPKKQDNLVDFFKDRRLNLAPEARATVLVELLQFMTSLEGTITFSNLTKAMRDRMKSDHALARNRISEILNCLRYSDYFLDDKCKPVRSVHRSISVIKSMELGVLEAVCMEYYAKKILTLFDPGFFETQETIQEFEHLIQGKAPETAKINTLKKRSLKLI